MLSWNEFVLLWTWMSFGAAGTLILLASWREWTRTDLSAHIGIYRCAVIGTLIVGGMGTLVVAGIFRLALDGTHKENDKAERDERARAHKPGDPHASLSRSGTRGSPPK